MGWTVEEDRRRILAERELRESARAKACTELCRLVAEYAVALDARTADQAAELLAKMKESALYLEKRVTLDEECARLDRHAEAELRDIERTKANAEVIALGQEEHAARDAGDLTRADALRKQWQQLTLEIRQRFGS